MICTSTACVAADDGVNGRNVALSELSFLANRLTRESRLCRSIRLLMLYFPSQIYGLTVHLLCYYLIVNIKLYSRASPVVTLVFYDL